MDHPVLDKCNIVDRLVGDVLLGTSFLSYSGPFNQEFRQKVETNWQNQLSLKQIPFSRKLNVTSLLVDGPTVAEWNTQVANIPC